MVTVGFLNANLIFASSPFSMVKLCISGFTNSLVGEEYAFTEYVPAGTAER
jgi:hypothetical protein